LAVGKVWHDVAGQQLLVRQQPGILKRLEIRQVAQRVETELQQECFRGDVGVGRAGRRAARSRGDQACAAQMADQVARNFLAEKLGSSARVIGWK
jgi:hypothetical protein